MGDVRLDANKIDIFGARRADVADLGAREPLCRGFGIAKSVESGKVSLNKVGIGRMSDERDHDQNYAVRDEKGDSGA